MSSKETFYNNVFGQSIVSKVQSVIDLVLAETKSSRIKDKCKYIKSLLFNGEFVLCSVELSNLSDERGMRGYRSFFYVAKDLLEILESVQNKGVIVDYNAKPFDSWKHPKFKFEQNVLIFGEKWAKEGSGEIVGMLYSNDGWEYHVKTKVFNNATGKVDDEIVLVYEDRLQLLDH
jgi:hypothetical protein